LLHPTVIIIRLKSGEVEMESPNEINPEDSKNKLGIDLFKYGLMCWLSFFVFGFYSYYVNEDADHNGPFLSNYIFVFGFYFIVCLIFSVIGFRDHFKNPKTIVSYLRMFPKIEFWGTILNLGFYFTTASGLVFVFYIFGTLSDALFFKK
jgi:hypothetical protein